MFWSPHLILGRILQIISNPSLHHYHQNNHHCCCHQNDHQNEYDCLVADEILPWHISHLTCHKSQIANHLCITNHKSHITSQVKYCLGTSHQLLTPLAVFLRYIIDPHWKYKCRGTWRYMDVHGGTQRYIEYMSWTTWRNILDPNWRAVHKIHLGFENWPAKWDCST